MIVREYDKQNNSIKKEKHRKIEIIYPPEGIQKQDKSLGTSISSTTTVEQVVAADIIPANTGRRCILKICVPVVNKDTGDGDILKENSQYHRSNTYFIEALNTNYEGEQKTGEIEESDVFISVKCNFKKHLPFLEKKTIKTIKTVS